MSIEAITIQKNPVASNALNFNDTLLPGTDSGWAGGSYRHSIRAMGGFWDCKFDILPRAGLDYLEEYLLNGLTRMVQSHAQGQVAWEGYITRLVYRFPGGSMEVSTRYLANKAWARYLTAEGGLIKRSTTYEDTDSQALYGIKEEVLQGAITNDVAVVNQAVQAYLAEYADPRQPSGGADLDPMRGGDIKLEVHCSGYFRSLDWQTYNQTTTQTDQDIDAQIQDIVDASGQFVKSTNLASNTTQVNQYYDADEPASDLILNLARESDASLNRYVIGMYADRKLIYETAKSNDDTARYALRIRDNKQQITDFYTGGLLSPALVRPNEFLRFSDVFVSQLPQARGNKSDPQVSFVESVTYSEPLGVRIDSNRGQSVDNLMALSGFGGASLT